MVDHQIFEGVDVGEAGERFEYRLTEKGEALLTVLTAMREWSDEWVFGRGNEPLIVRDRRTSRRAPKLRITDTDRRVLTRRDLPSRAPAHRLTRSGDSREFALRRFVDFSASGAISADPLLTPSY